MNWGDRDIESIKRADYDMKCPYWKQGKYDWSEDEGECK